ncbi:tyrosine-type recombinase/integrase [Thermodesulfobacteriota bacterium]
MAVRMRKDGRWICYFRKNGKLENVYFGRGAEGEAAARQYDAGLNLKKRRPRQSTLGPAFGELARAYVQKKVFSDNSKKMLLIRLSANILPFFGNMAAIKLNDDDLDAYIKKRRGQKVKYSTIRRELFDVKAILNWSVKRRPKLIAFNPVKDYSVPKSDDDVILPPTADETNRILKEAGPHLTRAIFLSYYLGLRPGAVELLSLTWKNVTWEKESIRIISAHKGGPESREVPIHEDLIVMLRHWYIEDKKKGPIIHYHGRPVKNILKAWSGTLKRARIKRRIRPYDLRHHFVTRALENGADLKALSEIVGSRPETLMKHYQHVSKKLHRQTVSKIPSLTIQNMVKIEGSNKEKDSVQAIE